MMRNQPRTVETPIAMIIPMGADMAALWVSSAIYVQHSVSNEGVVIIFSYVCAGIEACKGILGHEDTDHNDVSFARADTPTGIPGVIQKLGEHKAAWLEFRSRGENGNDHDKGPNGVPQHRNAIYEFQETDSITVVPGYTFVRLGRV